MMAVICGLITLRRSEYRDVTQAQFRLTTERSRTGACYIFRRVRRSQVAGRRPQALPNCFSSTRSCIGPSMRIA